MLNRDTIKLLRIPFSVFLMPVFLFALSQTIQPDLRNAIIVFFVLHLFIYPASNGYNSFMDQDEGSIGGLKNPPKATQKLFYAALLFDITGLILALWVSLQFFICVLIYIIASRSYSYKGIRLKRFPIIGFLTVIIFQGAFTYYMVYSAIETETFGLTSLQLPLIASSLLIAGVYPLTQIYQHKQDYASGDITLSYRLGYKGTFIFSAIMFGLANLLLYFYFSQTKPQGFLYLQICLAPTILYFVYWASKVWKNTQNADFEHTMRMNLIASVCMNGCFLTLLLTNIL